MVSMLNCIYIPWLLLQMRLNVVPVTTPKPPGDYPPHLHSVLTQSQISASIHSLNRTTSGLTHKMSDAELGPPKGHSRNKSSLSRCESLVTVLNWGHGANVRRSAEPINALIIH